MHLNVSEISSEMKWSNHILFVWYVTECIRWTDDINHKPLNRIEIISRQTLSSSSCMMTSKNKINCWTVKHLSFAPHRRSFSWSRNLSLPVNGLKGSVLGLLSGALGVWLSSETNCFKSLVWLWPWSFNTDAVWRPWKREWEMVGGKMELKGGWSSGGRESKEWESGRGSCNKECGGEEAWGSCEFLCYLPLSNTHTHTHCLSLTFFMPHRAWISKKNYSTEQNTDLNVCVCVCVSLCACM